MGGSNQIKNMAKITMYKTPNCKYCKEAAVWFSDQNIAFTTIDVSVNKEEGDKMVEISGQMGVPIIVVDNKEVIVGFNKKVLSEILGIKNDQIS